MEVSWTDREKWILSSQGRGECTACTIEKADWIGHVLRMNCLKHIIEGKIEGLM